MAFINRAYWLKLLDINAADLRFEHRPEFRALLIRERASVLHSLGLDSGFY